MGNPIQSRRCFVIALRAGWMAAVLSGPPRTVWGEPGSAPTDAMSGAERRAVAAAWAAVEEGGDPGAALATLRAALPETPSPRALYGVGVLAWRAERNDEAMDALRQSLRRDPDRVDAALLLAGILVRERRSADALAVLAPWRRAPDAPLETWRVSARAWLEEDRLLNAESAARYVLLRDDRDAGMRQVLLMALAGQRRHAEAAALCAEMLRDDPTDAALWRLRMQSLADGGDREPALAALAAARGLGVADAGMVRLGAEWMMADGHGMAAVEMLRESLRLDPAATAPRAAELSIWMRSMGENAVADVLDSDLDALPEALLATLPAVRSALRHAQAVRHVRDDDPEHAVIIYTELLADDPLDAVAWVALGDLQRVLNRPDEAELSYERAMRRPGHEAFALLRLADLCISQGRYRAALGHAESALQYADRPALRRYVGRLRQLADDRSMERIDS